MPLETELKSLLNPDTSPSHRALSQVLIAALPPYLLFPLPPPERLLLTRNIT